MLCLCWLSQKHAEKQSCIQRVKAGEIEPIPLASLAPMTLQIGHADLPNRVGRGHVWSAVVYTRIDSEKAHIEFRGR
jgi:hypothetical protein